MTQATTFYEAVGGEPTFRRLVAGFYRRVATDPVLRPLYPEPDLSGAEERLRLSLMQYWGGPHTYSDRRGHPALRMRHARFAIGPAERDAWLRHMTAAVQDLDLPPSWPPPCSSTSPWRPRRWPTAPVSPARSRERARAPVRRGRSSQAVPGDGVGQHAQSGLEAGHRDALVVAVEHGGEVAVARLQTHRDEAVAGGAQLGPEL